MSRKPSLNWMLKNIITDVRKTTKSALEYAGKKVSDDLGQMAYFALDRYYQEYTKPPRVYKRTNELRDHSYYKVNNRDGFRLTAGVIFDPSMMHHEKLGYKAKRDSDGNIMRDSEGKAIVEDYITEYEIFSNFLEGIHGWPGLYDGINRENFMDKYYDSYIKRGKPYKYFQDYMDKHLNR